MLIGSCHALLTPWGVNNAQLFQNKELNESFCLKHHARPLIENNLKKIIISFVAAAMLCDTILTLSNK